MISKENIIKKTPLFKLTNRLVLFLIALIFLVFIFYVSGNWQNFLDKNQILLLQVVSVLSVLLVFFVVVGLVMIVHHLMYRKTIAYLRFLFMYIGYILFGILMFAFSTFISFFSQ